MRLDLLGGPLRALEDALRLRAERRRRGLPDSGPAHDHTVLLGLHGSEAEAAAQQLAAVFCSLGATSARNVHTLRWADIASIEQDAGTWRFERARQAAAGGMLHITDPAAGQGAGPGGAFAIRLLTEAMDAPPAGPLIVLSGSEAETRAWLQDHRQINTRIGHRLGPLLTADELTARLSERAGQAGWVLSADAAAGLRRWYAGRLADVCDEPWDPRDLERTLTQAIRQQAHRLAAAGTAAAGDADLVTLYARDFPALRSRETGGPEASSGGPPARPAAGAQGAAPGEARPAQEVSRGETRPEPEADGAARRHAGRLRKALVFCGNAQRRDADGMLIVAAVDPYNPSEWEAPEFYPASSGPDHGWGRFAGSPDSGGLLLSPDPETGQVYTLRRRCLCGGLRSIRQDVRWDGSRFRAVRPDGHP